MQCDQKELLVVRQLVIGSVFERDGLERMVTGISWSPRHNTWYVEWSRRGSEVTGGMRLKTWEKWRSRAKLIFDMVDGPWIAAK